MTIVKENRFIAIRPLVLTYIHDIVEKNEPITTTLALYDIIIESILKRDIDKTKKQKNEKELNEKIKEWWEASSNVASYMYQHNRLTITDTELEKILPHSIDKSFKQRSLLTRYENAYHFSHKSFYEYFMAYRFFLFPNEIKQLFGLDFAKKLYDEMYNTFISNQNVIFYDFTQHSLEKVALSLYRIGVSLQYTNEAEIKYQTALKIYRQIKQDPNIAQTLNQLSTIHLLHDNIRLSKEESKEALDIYRKLTEQRNNEYYLPFLAETLFSYSLLCLKTDKNLSIAAVEESIEIYRQLEKIDFSAYHNKVIEGEGIMELTEKYNQYQAYTYYKGMTGSIEDPFFWEP